jgi:NAD+ diphosphatase
MVSAVGAGAIFFHPAAMADGRTMIEHTRFVYCPRCGLAELKEFQSNAMRCTECGYVYFHNTASAVGAVIVMTEGILLTKRGHEPHIGKYDLPGGFVEYNETLESALIREVKEELGITVLVEKYLGSFPNTYVYRRVTYFTCDSFFVCRYDGGKETISPNREIAGWMITLVDKLPFGQFGFVSHEQALNRYREITGT